jgi:hypothetical protein
MRALSYIVAARHIQTTYFPKAQLQIIFPKHTIQRANRIPVSETENSAIQLINTTRRLLPTEFVGQEIVFATDAPLPPPFDINYLASTLQDTPAMATLKKQAERRRAGNTSYTTELEYLAGHLYIHDTVHSILPFFGGDTLREGNCIISIGAMSERPFYVARMAYRKASPSDSSLASATGQLFTRHVLPPYIARRQPRDVSARLFDPTCHDTEALFHKKLDDPFGHLDSVVRDIRHLQTYLRTHDLLPDLR